MKSKFKLVLICTVIAAALICPLQSPAFADNNAKLNKDISAATKTPISKKQIALKFVMAMAGVAASAVVIYVGLSFYNKLFREQSEPVVGLNSLRTPENFKESINLFLEKTNWD